MSKPQDPCHPAVTIVDHLSAAVECPKLAEAVSKLEITRFSGVALPFPECREADTEHSGGSTFAPDVDVTRFDTTSAEFCLTAIGSTHPIEPFRQCVRLSLPECTGDGHDARLSTRPLLGLMAAARL
ncbi:hypothetical protein [Paraburkholderia nodosa]|uniref:hypothetical protein n=1 Tax=Paraburkholderia nodosa TaxID=392320 RepID=UPI0012B6A0E6|nr:hypothetical protein [Paraburkholderia nodosa]